MEIDIARWHQLTDRIQELNAQRHALSNVLYELSGRQLRARADLASLEREHPRPAPETTLASAREQIAQANAASVDRQRRPIQADFDATWFAQAEVVAELDAEEKRLRERQGQLHETMMPLERLRDGIEKWAVSQHIALPGAGRERMTTILPPTVPPNAPPPFGNPLLRGV